MAKTNTKTSADVVIETKETNVSAKASKTKEVTTKKADAKPVVSKSKEVAKKVDKAVASTSTTAKQSKKTDDAVKSVNPENIESKVVVNSKTESKKETPVSVVSPVKHDVRYSDSDLEMFSEVILEAKTEALDELRMLKERLEDLTSFDAGEESMIYSMHMAEQGSEAQEKEKTYAQIQRISEHIKKLEDAMERIRNKSYGVCRVCGCLIAKERLLAVPITTLSAAYKIHSKCPDDGIDKIEPVRI